MSDMIQINFRCNKNLADKIKTYCPEGKKSEFICEAISEKLNRKTISMDETYHWLKKLDKLDTESIYKKTVDVEFTSQVIFEEIKKQNEVLKLILRRASLGGVFGGEILDQMDSKMKEHREKEAITAVKSELEYIKL